MWIFVRKNVILFNKHNKSIFVELLILYVYITHPIIYKYLHIMDI